VLIERRISYGPIQPADSRRAGQDSGNQDLLIDRYVVQKEALDKGLKAHAIEISLEIKELHREMEKIKEWAKV
jgi:hypothetical protein